MNWDDLATKIIDAVGGISNVKNATHCATRLRLTLYDDSKVNQERIDNFTGVLGVVNQGGQLQIIIGNDVSSLYDAFLKHYQPSEQADPSEDKENKKGITKVLDIISGIFIPVIPAMAGSGMLKALLAVLAIGGVISTTSQTYIILNFVSDTVFYFLPVLLAHSASLKFKTNPYVAMVIGAMLIHPTFISMVQVALKSKGTISLLGLPVTLATYSSSVVPILLAMWAMSYVEPLVTKIIPKVLRIFLVPMIVLVIMTPLTFVVLAPVGAWLGDGLAAIITWINLYAGWTIPLIVGALSNNNSIAYSEEEVCSVCHMPTLKWTYNPEVHGYYCDYCQDWDSADLHNSNPVNYLKTEIYMSHITYYSCRDCRYTTEKTEQCNLINFQKVDENT